MKKSLSILFGAIIGAILSTQIFAGGIDNKTNFSTEYIRTLNRNAATDAADIVAYNPAGVMKLDRKAYLNLSMQYIDKEYSNTINGIDYESDEPSFVPSFFGLYKKNNWAAFVAFTVPGGGGEVDYDRGNATTSALGYGLISGANTKLDEASGILPSPLTPSMLYYSNIRTQTLKANSYYYGYTFGGAYKFNDLISLSLGLRYIDASKAVDGTVTVSAENSQLGTVPGINDDITANVDFDQEADGWGAIFGINLSPNDNLNIGMRYETKTSLEFETGVNEDNIGLLPQLGVEDGAKSNRDLPAIYAFGVSYKLFPKFRIESNLTYYLQEEANWEGAEEDVKNGYDIGLALEYMFNEKLKASLGYLYTNTGIKAEDMSPEAPELNANTLGTGVAYEAFPGLTVNLAVGNAFYQEESFIDSSTGAKIEYDKNNLFLGLGIQYEF